MSGYIAYKIGFIFPKFLHIELLKQKMVQDPSSNEVDSWKREIIRSEKKLVELKAFCSSIKHYNRDFKYKGDFKNKKPDKTQMDKADKLLICENS